IDRQEADDERGNRKRQRDEKGLPFHGRQRRGLRERLAAPPPALTRLRSLTDDGAARSAPRTLEARPRFLHYQTLRCKKESLAIAQHSVTQVNRFVTCKPARLPPPRHPKAGSSC